MKTFGLALGGGGARGIAHIAVLEALDDMSVRPAAIAGTSIGGLIGAAYAAGMSGKEIRRYVVSLAHDRSEVVLRAKPFLPARRAVIENGVGGPPNGRFPGVHHVQRDVAQLLDEHGIAVRAGHHCARPVCVRFGVPATTRASFGIYTTTEEIDALVRGVEQVKEMFA